MTKFILHIGTHKTGTTAIQDYLSENRERLLEYGVDFPVVGRTPEGSQAHRHFSAFCRNFVTEIPPEFEQAISGGFTHAETCILSSEDFWFCADRASVRRVYDIVGENATVVCFLRDPVSHIFSMYREALKSGTTASCVDFVEQFREGLVQGDTNSYYRYEERLGHWREFWPVAIIHYCDRADAVTSFLAQSGISLQTDEWPAPGRKNEAMSDVSAMMLLRLNRMAESGAMSPVTRRAYKRKALLMSKALQADYASLLISAAVDVSPLKAAFAEQNPNLEALCNTVGDNVVQPVDIDLPNDGIGELLNKIWHDRQPTA
jgi:hypothetical protein